VVIPAIKPGLVDHCIEAIRKYGARVRDIYVVSPIKLTDKAIWIDEASFPFNKKSVASNLFQDEAKAVEYLEKHRKGRIGWYLQQLLKLYSPIVIPNISSNVLILDSDVIFLQPIEFLNEKNEPLFCPGREHHKPYFSHAAKLLPGFVRCLDGEKWASGISHHMVMQRDSIIQLLALIESIHGVPAWQAMCHCINATTDLPKSGFSEYEIYFNFILSSGSQGHVRPLHWKNAQNSFNWDNPEAFQIAVNEYKAMGYVYIAKHA
jgi:hypothetical protein